MCNLTYNGKQEKYSNVKIVVLPRKVRILGKHSALICEIPTKRFKMGEEIKEKIEYFASFLEIVDLNSFLMARNKIGR